MKKPLSLICSIVFLLSLMTSCEGQNGIGGNAPNNIAGKTMVIRDRDGDLEWKIVFNSNTSATLSRYNQTYSFSSIKYKKSGSHSAIVQIIDIDTRGHYADGTLAPPETENYSLVFTSSNEGTVKGSVYGGVGIFTLF